MVIIVIVVVVVTWRSSRRDSNGKFQGMLFL